VSLRRTALARKTQLQRGASQLRRTPLARSREQRARPATSTSRSRDTGPTPATRALVLDRAAGCCELCGRILHDGYAWLEEHSFHHRQPRGMGGTSNDAANSPSNLLLLCGSATTKDGCHAFVESHRRSAEGEGWLVRRPTDPATVPVTVFAGGDADLATTFTRRVLLTDEGTYLEAAA